MRILEFKSSGTYQIAIPQIFAGWLGLAILFSLSGCNSGQELKSDSTAETPLVSTGQGHSISAEQSAELLKGNHAGRLRSLAEIVNGTGGKCLKPSQIVYDGTQMGSDYWRINCVDTGSWSIQLRTGEHPQSFQCKKQRDTCF
jgi:hypothetical protein